MKTNGLNASEKDNKLKKKYLPKCFWLKNMAIYPPVIFLFFALFGLVYLLNYNMLLTYYALPFAVIFLLATIWFKTTKRAILKKMFENGSSYLICLARVIEEEGDWVYAVFTTDQKRHNKYFIHDLAKNTEKGFLTAGVKNEAKKKAQKLSPDASPVSGSAYVKGLRKNEVNKSLYTWQADSIFPVFYINEDNILLIKRKDLDFS